MAQDQNNVPNQTEKKKYSRRDFLTIGGTAIAGTALAAYTPSKAEAQTEEYPLSTRYLVCDSKNCAGCYRCMIACYTVNHGEVNFSLSRIQVHRSVLDEYPFDIQINLCRQCPDPLCVTNCPTGACHISAENGNVRMINEEECIGCKTCIQSCPFIPHRPIWNHLTEKATKCDLCSTAPYYNKKGGVNGSQACVEVCPANALKVVTELPDQTDLNGYDRNLQPPRKAMPAFPFAAPKAKPKAKE
jgi:protein NrfC